MKKQTVKQFTKRSISLLLTLVMLLSLLPQLAPTAKAAGDYGFGTTDASDSINSSTGIVSSLNGKALVGLYYNGSTFPGEPRVHWGGGYVTYNTNFEAGESANFKVSELLKPSVLEACILGQGTNLGAIWGGTYYSSSTSGIFDPNGLDDEFFTEQFKTALAAEEQNMIQDVIDAKGALDESQNPADYEIVWYVIKYQTSDKRWHINGLIREKDKYSVVYDANGATEGSPPDGVIDMSYSDAQTYTVQSNADGLARSEYDFIGWNTKANGSGIFYSAGQTADLTVVGENAITLYAQWKENEKYTVTWLNGDGTAIHMDTGLTAGAKVTYDGAAPTKAPTDDTVYTFAGWAYTADGANLGKTPTVEVTGDMTMYPLFTESDRTYTVTWVNNTVIHTDTGLTNGATVSYDGATPTRSTTETEGYLFDGWATEENGAKVYEPNAAITVTGDTTLYALFTLVPMRTVTWYSEDGNTVLATQRALEGSSVTYPNAAPTKEGHTFTGWATAANGEAAYAAAVTVSGNMSLYAAFEPKTHTVTWVNWDNSELETDSNVPYGTMPEYNGETPTRADDVDKTYTFIGWEPTVSSVTGDISYKAKFSEATRAYTVTWQNWDGTTIYTESVNYGVTPQYTGSEPVRPETATHTFTFDGWTPTISEVSGDVTYTAIYTAAPKGHTAYIYVMQDGTYNAETHEPNSDAIYTDIEKMMGSGVTLSLKKVAPEADDDFGKSFPLTKTTDSSGRTVYQSELLLNGTYNIYSSQDAENPLCEQQVIILDANRTRYVYFNSVAYKDGSAEDGGATIDTEYHHNGSRVTVTRDDPSREGYVFIGWDIAETTDTTEALKKDDVVEAEIYYAHTLVARWRNTATVNLTVNINRTAVSGTGIDPDPDGTLNVSLTYKTPEESDYVEVVSVADKNDSNWYSETENTSISLTYNGIFTDLDSAYQYSANVILDSYMLTERTVSAEPAADGHVTYNVAVTLQYNPDMFDAVYTVQVDSTVLDSQIPAAVDIKLMSWNSNEADKWAPISRHQNSATDVDLNDNRTADGSYGVPVHRDASDDPYYYRVAAVGFTLADGTELTATSENGIDYLSAASADGRYAAGAYSARISVDGATISGTSLPGVYGVKDTERSTAEKTVYKQQGTMTVTIFVKDASITLNLNDGESNDAQLDGGSADKVLENQFYVPNLSGYAPTREGYTFGGWYKEADCTNEVIQGKALDSDVTYYAKWKPHREISGTVYVAGTYDQTKAGSTTTHVINPEDRLTEILVALQKVTADGLAATVDHIHATVSYDSNNLGSVGYKFSDVPDDGMQYRILILQGATSVLEAAENKQNFTDLYQNEPESLQLPPDFDDYGSSAEYYMAEYGTDAPKVATVNAYLKFTPVNFTLNYQVDASAISEDYRPKSVDVLVVYNSDQTGSSPNWKVITQQVIDGVETGDTLVLNKAETVSGSRDVWQVHANGNGYDYAVRLQDYVPYDGSSAVDFDSNTPFAVTYIPAEAYWDADAGKQTPGTLVAKVTPKTYAITYNLNAGTDPVQGLNGEPVSHTWSYETTEIPLALSRDGYDFLGWDCSVGDAYADGKISAGTAQDITLTAQWRKQKPVTFRIENGTWAGGSDASYTVNVSLDGSSNGTVSVPTGMQPDYGYGNGAWVAPVPDGTVSGSDAITYTYRYERLSVTVGYNAPQTPITNSTTPAQDSLYYGDYIRVEPNGGVWTHNSTVYTDNIDLKLEANAALADPTRSGYLFAGWRRHYISDTASHPGFTVTHRYVAQWLADADGDSTPDIYEKKITFRIENGTWDGSDSADRVIYVNLNGSGSGTMTVPTGMKGKVGYIDDGIWSPELPADNAVSGTESAVYTYRHMTTVTYADYTRNGEDSVYPILPNTAITVDPNGGTWNGSTSAAGMLITAATTLEDPTYTNQTFLGWKRVDNTFTAQWQPNTYEILWKNHDGTLLETDPAVTLGDTPSYDGTTPTKDPDAQYTYTFTGWSPEVVPATSNAVYTAVFTSQLRSYTVTWLNHDGTTLGIDTVKYGQSPVYTDSTPTKTGDAQYSYAHSGWWLDADGNGTVDAGETYAKDAALPTVEGNVTYKATFTETVNTYTVKWVDEDGTSVLETDENVSYGTAPSYDGTEPTKAATAQFTYAFAGWTPAVSAVTGDVTYKATYTSTVNKYTVKWVDSDGTTVLETDYNVPYGEMPSYNGTAPNELAAAKTTASAGQYTYIFTGWTPTVESVTGDVTYQATYSQTLNRYTVTWIDYNGNVLDTDTVKYGDWPQYTETEPSRVPTAQYTYTFDGWKNTDGIDNTVYASTGSFPAVTGNVTYQAQYEATQVAYDVTVKLYLDNVLVDSEDVHGNHIHPFLSSDGGNTVYEGDDNCGGTKTVGTFVATNVPNGTYKIYVKDGSGSYRQICEQLIVVENADVEKACHYYSVTYNGNGADSSTVPAASAHHLGTKVTVDDSIPTRDGYIFKGWVLDENNNGTIDSTEATIYQPGAALTSSIVQKYTLIAQWVETVDIKVNVVIDHTSSGSGCDSANNKADVSLIELVEEVSTGYWNETGDSFTLAPADGSHPKHDIAYEYLSGQSDFAHASKTTYTANTATFTGLDPDKNYSVTVTKAGYDVISTATSGNTITVTLKHVPDSFELDFSVEMEDKTNSSTYPDAAIIKVLYWNGTSWGIISQQAGTLPGVRVNIDKSSGTGSGSMTVWNKYNGDVCDYRIAVVSFIYDGAAHPASSSDLIDYTDNVYTAVMQLVGTTGHQHSNLDGAYWNDSTQVGTLKAVISLNKHNVVLQANGGTFSGSQTSITLADQFTMPDISGSAYVPSNANNTFDGYDWYKDENNNGVYDVGTDTAASAVSAGTKLGSSYVLVARWKAPWTVKGDIEVAGSYDLDGDSNTTNDIKIIQDADRIKNLTVLLQYAPAGSEKFTNRQSYVATINYTNDVGTGSFEFTNVPNDGGTWRIHVLNHNYGTTYNNEPIDDNIFAAVDYSLAVDKNSDNTAEVDVKMSFTPQPFNLYYKVDASAIGDGTYPNTETKFRPSTAEVLVLYDDAPTNTDRTPQQWPVISQMQTGGTAPDFTYTGVTDTIGTEHSYSVWRYHPTGYLYDYAIKVQSVTDYSTIDDDTPFTIEYNGTAEYADPGYDAGKTQTQLLTATLKPKSFTVKYYLEHFGANASVEIPGMSVSTHTWSHETELKNGSGNWIDVPTRAGYVFNGWVDALGNPVSSIAAATAETVNLYASWKYPVRWLNDNGALIETTYVAYGDTPTYPAPTKDPDAQYSYTFDAWSPAITAVTGNVTYTATYTPTLRTYTVKWWNDVDSNGAADPGEILETDSNVLYGDTPEYNGTAPTKTGDAQYSYTFSGWSPAVSAVTGNVTYKATFDQTVNTYTVTWKNGSTEMEVDYNVPYGTTPAYNSITPTKDSTAQYSYTHSGWWLDADGDGVKDAGETEFKLTDTLPTVAGNVTYQATFSETVNTYTVTWKNGTDVLDTHTVAYGNMPVYTGATPTKASTAQYSYMFTGWTPTVSAVTGNVTYTAAYSPITQSYTVTWVNYDGTPLETDTMVPYGVTPKYDGATPTKPADVQYTYTFASWTPAVDTVKKSITYTASFSSTPNQYTVRYVDGVDGSVIFADQTHTADYGAATPAFSGSLHRSGYTFAGWSPAVAPTVTGNATYTAQWEVYYPPVTTGSVILTKTDTADTTKVLSNVAFDLYRANGTKVASYTTNADGKITIHGLSAGDYYWLETRPAEGYVKDNQKQTFTVRAGQTTFMTLTNTHAPIPSQFSTEHYAFVIGYNDGLVHPERNITRAEAATVFFRMLNDPTRDQYLTRTNSFSDVEPTAWYNTAVSTMASMGVIGGYPDSTFRPNENITRAELIAMAVHFAPNGDTTPSPFTDISDHWAVDEIHMAANYGWTLGNGTDLFNPDELITRAEAMALVNRVLQRLPETTDDLLPDMVTWPDNTDPSQWYYLAIQEAGNSHNYVRKDNGYESWTELTEAPDWKQYE